MAGGRENTGPPPGVPQRARRRPARSRTKGYFRRARAAAGGLVSPRASERNGRARNRPNAPRARRRSHRAQPGGSRRAATGPSRRATRETNARSPTTRSWPGGPEERTGKAGREGADGERPSGNGDSYRRTPDARRAARRVGSRGRLRDRSPAERAPAGPPPGGAGPPCVAARPFGRSLARVARVARGAEPDGTVFR